MPHKTKITYNKFRKNYLELFKMTLSNCKMHLQHRIIQIHAQKSFVLKLHEYAVL